MQLRSWFMVSVVLNAGLLITLGWTWHAGGARNAERLPSGARKAADPVFESSAIKHDSTPREPESLIGVRDALRAAGVGPEQIQQVLSAMLQKQRYQAKRASSWWKGTPYGGNLQFSDPVEMNKEREELRRLVDESSMISSAATEINLDYIAESKRKAVVRILLDYAQVKAQHTSRGLRFSADQAQDELLRGELQSDLRAVLTEEEYLEHTLRDVSSMEWVRLRTDAVALNLTELEFRETARALLAARALVNEDARTKAVEQVHADLRTRVGEDRVWNTRAKNSHEFYQLRDAQVRFGFPQDATDRVVAAWHRAFEAAEALRAETADAAKRASGWRALAMAARTEVVTALGEEAGKAYLEQAMPWLRDWDRGTDTRWNGIMKKQ